MTKQSSRAPATLSFYLGMYAVSKYRVIGAHVSEDGNVTGEKFKRML